MRALSDSLWNYSLTVVIGDLMPGSAAKLGGNIQPGYESVLSAFENNFDEFDERAAAFCVYKDGQKVVDLWGGTAEFDLQPMRDDTLMRVASCSKGVTATVLGVLVEEGVLSPEQTVASLWPEFATFGKEATTIGMVASHQAGLPFPPIGSGLRGLEYFTGEKLLAALAGATPWWAPGSAVAYHPATAGALLDEIVRRACGSSIGQVLNERVAEPLGLSMWIGLPPKLVKKVIPGTWEASISPMAAPATAPDKGTYASLRAAALAEASDFEPDPNSNADRISYFGAEMPAIGVITDARSLARMYAATIGPVDGIRLFSDATLRKMTTSMTANKPMLIEEGTAGPDLDFGFGYQLSTSSMPGFGRHSFGHTGAGGRLGLADPTLGVAIGYVCSSMRNIGPNGDPRWKTLIDAVSASVTTSRREQ